MNQVKRVSPEVSAEPAMDHPLENNVRRPCSRRRRGPRELAATTKPLADEEEGPCNELVIDEMEMDNDQRSGSDSSALRLRT